MLLLNYSHDNELSFTHTSDKELIHC
jgi:hypothetical protein